MVPNPSVIAMKRASVVPTRWVSFPSGWVMTMSASQASMLIPSQPSCVTTSDEPAKPQLALASCRHKTGHGAAGGHHACWLPGPAACPAVSCSSERPQAGDHLQPPLFTGNGHATAAHYRYSHPLVY